jgi:Zn-dependent protease with chaperone function
VNDDDRSGGPSTEVVRARVRFPGISSRAYEHPADRGGLTTLRSVPGFAPLLKAVSGAIADRSERLLSLGSGIRVGPNQYPRLYELVRECAEILDVDPVPELFVHRYTEANALTIGLDKPFILLYTGLIDALDDESLRFVIGHEMGHVLSGHAVYHTMLYRLINLAGGFSWLPGGVWGMRAVQAALAAWYRKAELSADRAGLLCGQDPQAALRAHIVMSGATDPADVNVPEFLRQAHDYESGGDLRDSVLKLLNVERMSHPMAVARAAELQRWSATPDYRDILTGVYPRRDEEAAPHATWTEDVKSAAKSVKDRMTESEDPLAKILNDVGGSLSDAAGKVWGMFKPAGDEPSEAASEAS